MTGITVKVTALFIVLILAAGCAGTRESAELQLSHPGRITEKEKISGAERHSGTYRERPDVRTSVFVSGGSSGVGLSIGVLAPLLLFSSGAPADRYRYRVITRYEKTMSIESPDANFHIGDCVTVFIGKMSGSVSMARDADCLVER